MRNDEEIAISIVRHWANGAGSVKGLGRGDNADFEIKYFEGAVGLGEIKSDVHESQRAQWEALLKRKGSQIFELPAGMGAWSFRIDSEAHIGHLESVLGEVISSLASLGHNSWSREWSYPRTEFDSAWATLGIIDFHKASGISGDYAYVQPNGIGGMVPTDANMAIPWIESLLEEEDWQKSWARLKDSNADERHIFLWIDSNSPSDLRLRVTFHADEPPTVFPNLPSGITHLWVGVAISFQSHASAWLYRAGFGWEPFTAPYDLPDSD